MMDKQSVKYKIANYQALTSNRWIAHRLRLGEEVPESFDTSGTGGLDPRPTLRLEIYVSHYRESIRLQWQWTKGLKTYRVKLDV